MVANVYGIALNSVAGDIEPSPGTASAGSTGTAADAGHVHPEPADFAPTGLTGATAASRWVGATASGAPGSGTFVVGDFVIDQTGKVWVCTTGGSPGTWTEVGTGLTNPMSAVGDLIDGGTAGAPTRLAGNTTTTRKFLRQTGTGSASAAPAWDTLQSGDLPSGVTLTGYLAPAVVALTFGTTISINAALGNVFAVTLTASTGTFAAPSNPVDGQVIRIRVAQDSIGSRTVSWASGTGGFDFGSTGGSANSAPTLTTTQSKTDILGFEYDAALSKWVYLSAPFPQGF